MKLTSLLAALIVTISAAPAFAGTDTPKIDKHQENQQKRIDEGVKSGALTAKETENLEKREAKIEADKTAAKADGKVTVAERHKLKREERKTSRAIHRQKHDQN